MLDASGKIFYMRTILPALMVCLLPPLLGGCGKSAEHAAPEKAKPAQGASASPTKGATLTVLQKQFLTIEAVGAAQSSEALTLPGRVSFPKATRGV